MATFTITIPDAVVPELIDAIDYYFTRDPAYTKPQWARRHIKIYLNTVLNRYRNKLAKEAVHVPQDLTVIDVA